MPSFNQFGLLCLEGIDAATFLQGQLTADALGLAVDDSVLAAHCDAKGRMVSSFVLYRRTDNTFYLQLPASMLPTATAALKKYAVFSKVTISDISASLNAKVIALKNRPPSTPQALCIPIPNSTLAVMWLTNDAADEAESGLVLDSRDWQIELIKQGIAFVTPQTTTEIIPQMLNLDRLGGISFNKGCYTGQEIIARMKYRGTVKRRTFQFSTVLAEQPTELAQWLNSNPELSGTRIVNASDQEMGLVVNAVVNNSAIYGLATCKSAVLNSEDALFLSCVEPTPIKVRLTLTAPDYLTTDE